MLHLRGGDAVDVIHCITYAARTPVSLIFLLQKRVLMRFPALFAMAVVAGPAFADAATDDAGAADQVIVVTAKRLNDARASIQPELGASLYSFDAKAIEALPGGRNVDLSQVLLRAPGVAQDSFGQIHVRGDHNGLQYRINGVILPEGLNVFGQSISPRFADKISLLTGALPAQYGLRTAGVINIARRGAGFDDGATISLYGGAHDTILPSFELSGGGAKTSYFASGSYRHSGLGIESPDGSSTPLHDKTDQFTGFAYVDHILSDDSKLSLILGSSSNVFQIPNNRGRQPDLGLVVNGVSAFPSEALDDRQRETTHYAIGSYLYTTDRFTGQLSLFGRYSSLSYSPGPPAGDLLYTGIGQTAYKRDVALGFQAEGKYQLSPAHTLRAGLIYQHDRSTSETNSLVLPLDGEGGQASDVPIAIADASRASANTFSAYVQDEWKPFAPLVVNFGLRFDRFEGYRDEQQLSPRLNVVLTPAAGTTIHVGYSRYFTPPPFELVANATVAKFAGTTGALPGAVASTTPFAERSNYYDAGISQEFGRLTLGLDLYYKDIANLLDEGQFGAPIILTPFNYAHGRVRGAELTANYQHGPWTLYGSVAVSKAQGTQIASNQASFDPAELAYIASHYIYVDHDQRVSASAGVSWSHDGTKLSVDGLYGSGLRSSAGTVPNGIELPGYVVINLAASHVFKLPVVGEIEGRIDVVNLFDEQYEIRDGTGVGVGASQFGTRRGIFAGLSKSF